MNEGPHGGGGHNNATYAIRAGNRLITSIVDIIRMFHDSPPIVSNWNNQTNSAKIHFHAVQLPGMNRVDQFQQPGMIY